MDVTAVTLRGCLCVLFLRGTHILSLLEVVHALEPESIEQPVGK